MSKAPSPWNQECRRQSTDFGTDDPTIALSPLNGREPKPVASGDHDSPRSSAVGLALAVGVGAVLSVIVVAVFAALSKPGACA